jgi:hypothetical protein
MLIDIYEKDYDLNEVYLFCQDIPEIYHIFKGRSMKEGDIVEKNNNLFICTKNSFEKIEWKNDD